MLVAREERAHYSCISAAVIACWTTTNYPPRIRDRVAGDIEAETFAFLEASEALAAGLAQLVERPTASDSLSECAPDDGQGASERSPKSSPLDVAGLREIILERDSTLYLVRIETKDKVSGQWQPSLLVVRDDVGIWYFACGIDADFEYARRRATEQLHALAHNVMSHAGVSMVDRRWRPT